MIQEIGARRAEPRVKGEDLEVMLVKSFRESTCGLHVE